MCLAIPGEILSIEGADPSLREAWVRFGSATRKVVLAFVPEATVGDFVLVHVGFALARINAAQADLLLRELGEALAADHADQGTDGSADVEEPA